MRLSILYKLNLIDPRVRLPATQLTLSWQPQPRTVGCLIGAAETRKGVVTFSLTPQRYARIRADPRTELLLLQGQMNRVHACKYRIYVCVCVIAKFCFYHTYICIGIAAENVFLIKYIIFFFSFDIPRAHFVDYYSCCCCYSTDYALFAARLFFKCAAKPSACRVEAHKKQWKNAQ